MVDIRKAEGVVIRRRLFSDTSLIATFFTDRFGKVRVIAKGALRRGSPLRGKLDLFMRNSILFYHGRGDLHIVKECDTIGSYGGIRDDLDRIVAASYIAEIVDGLTLPEAPDGSLYALLVQSLAALNASDRPVQVAACFAPRLLSVLGIFPRYSSCAECGERLEGERFYDGASFRCKGCLSRPAAAVSGGTAALIDRILSPGGPGPDALSPPAEQLSELVALSSAIFEAESGRRMKTRLMAWCPAAGRAVDEGRNPVQNACKPG
ncbi:MAG: DNA repair protein RecO [Candidatus Tritonobacter lacicola]|nr:DNA repair protein RecO [Candidatus Tritonobacter lacicola]